MKPKYPANICLNLGESFDEKSFINAIFIYGSAMKADEKKK